MAEDKGVVEGEKKETSSVAVTTKKRKGIVSRIWNGIFGLHGDDFEKRLQYIYKEEANVLKRMNRRLSNRRRRLRQLIVFSVILEFIAVGYAIMTTRSIDMDWKMRAVRVLPMFVLPALSSAVHSAFVRLTGMWERKDQKTLERLRAERQAKIDELKEKTNYYTTQQLIQRYDPDPAAKAAAATVLASKLGADSGLKVYLGDETEHDVSTGKSKDVEYVQASGLRNRKQVHARSNNPGSTTVEHPQHPEGEMLPSLQSEDHRILGDRPLAVEHHDPQISTENDRGWIAQLAAVLVGEDPTQSYALICGNCHMHNGLCKKEDFPYITYFCPHCRVLNQPKHLAAHVSGSSTHNSLRSGSNVDTIREASENVLPINNPANAGPEIEEVTERAASGDSGS